MYFVETAEKLGSDDWQISDAVDWRHPRLGCSSRPGTSVPFWHRWTVAASLNFTRSGTSSQCSSSCRRRDRPWSNLRVPETSRAAAFSTRPLSSPPNQASFTYSRINIPQPFSIDRGIPAGMDWAVCCRPLPSFLPDKHDLSQSTNKAISLSLSLSLSVEYLICLEKKQSISIRKCSATVPLGTWLVVSLSFTLISTINIYKLASM